MERWDVYDRHGLPTGETRIRDFDALFKDGEYLLAASLWIVNPHGQLLIQKRSLEKKVTPGKWSLTGGAVLAGETSAQGCVREAGGELGLYLDVGDVTFLYRSLGKNLIYDDYIVLRDLDADSLVLQPEEVAQVRWASLAQIRELIRRGDFIFENVRELEKVEGYIKACLQKGLLCCYESGSHCNRP